MNDSAYTLHYDSIPQRNKKGQWNKGGTSWNKGKKWNDIFDEQTQAKLRQHLKDIARFGAAGKGHPHPKPVIQMDEDGNRLHWYESSSEAERKTGVCRRNIRKVCEKERLRAGGYKWCWDERFLT